MKVYVLSEEYNINYEFSNRTRVYSTYEKARAKFDDIVNNIEEDERLTGISVDSEVDIGDIYAVCHITDFANEGYVNIIIELKGYDLDTDCETMV